MNAPRPNHTVAEQRVLVLAPTGRDAEFIADALTGAGLATFACHDASELAAEIERGAGAAIIAEEAVTGPTVNPLVAGLERQPRWSDIPLIVLIRREQSAELAEAGWEKLLGLRTAGNATLLERPLRTVTLISAARVALRSRRRQYELRDYLAEREERERELRQSEQRFRVMAEAVPDILFTADPAGAWNYVNHRFYDYTGLLAGEALGQGWAQALHPDDEPLYRQRWLAAAAAGERYQAECRLRTPEGGYRWFVLRSHPIYTPYRQLIQWFGTCTDVDDIKRGQEHRARLAALVESSSDAILGKTLDGTITSWNSGAEQMYGYRADEVLGRSIATVIPPERQDEIRRILDQLRRGERVEQLETVRVRKDGRRIDVALSVSPVKDGAGRPVAAVTIARDITDRKRADDELKALNETLEQRVAERTAEAERRTLQLRALAAELTQAEERERRRLAQTLHDHLQQLLVAGRLKLGPLRRRVGEELLPALEKVDGLLIEAIDASRSLTIELSPPVLYDGGLVAALEWLARHMEDKQGLHVEVSATAGKEPAAEDVRLLVFHAVRELLFNVVKHAQTDRVCVELDRADDGKLRVSVVDQGAGFDPRRLEADSASGNPERFGLFSIRERVEPVGGRLEIASAPGKGTRITIFVPVEEPVSVPSVSAAADAERTAATALARVARSTGKVRVLLADDHEIFREGLASLLWEEPDIELVGQAGDGQAAVELARRTQPDVILMDITMPRLNGVDATRRITAEMPGVRIIGLSMHEKQDMAQAMREAGAAAYLPKGGSSEALIATIRGLSAAAHSTAG